MVKVGVIGATGFTGEKLVEILLNHPKVEVAYIASRTKKPLLYSEIFPKFAQKTKIKCEPINVGKAVDSCDFLFLALPHTVSMRFVPAILSKGKKVIDLSADYRLNASLYKKFYNTTHLDSKNLKKAVYGLPELFAAKIKKTQLVANPGCYATSLILALYPLFNQNLVEVKVAVDSKSAVTGAGRKALLDFHYSNIENNFWAYKPFLHQHQPEVCRVIKGKSGSSPQLSFLPQVAGFEAGIYTTVHCSFKQRITQARLKTIYQDYYKDSFFIRISNSLPKLKDVVGTNFCDLGFAVDKSGRNGIIVSSIDNLIKGAAGQAVQNMNLMLGLGETAGFL